MNSDVSQDQSSAALDHALADLHAEVDQETGQNPVPLRDVLTAAGLVHLLPHLADDAPRVGALSSTRALEGRDDADLVRELQAQGCQGLLWLATMDDFSAYSWRAFERLFRIGSLTSRTHNRGRPIYLTRAEWQVLLMNPGELQELFYAALEKQIALFAARTCAGYGWVEGGGMPLRDYFFNGVLLQLANPVRAWRRRAARDGVVALVAPEHLDLAGRGALTRGPEETFLATASAHTVVAALASADPRLRDAILLRVDTGAQWRHIAAEVGLTPAALDSLRRRFAKSLSRATS